MDREEMIEFLTKHYRYDTMNSWNAATSYARNVKINHMNLPRDVRDRCYAALDLSEAFDEAHAVLENFAHRHGHEWSIDTNGRSNGYLVLYSGGVKNGRVFVRLGVGVDAREDFSGWSDEDLRERVDLVKDFDDTCERAVRVFVEFAKTHDVVEATMLVPTRVKVAVARE